MAVEGEEERFKCTLQNVTLQIPIGGKDAIEDSSLAATGTNRKLNARELTKRNMARNSDALASLSLADDPAPVKDVKVDTSGSDDYEGDHSSSGSTATSSGGSSRWFGLGWGS